MIDDRTAKYRQLSVYFIERQRCLDKMLNNINPGRVLEIGSGTGWWTDYFRARFDIMGMDIDVDRVKLAKCDYGDFFMVGDAISLPFRTESLDLVMAIDVIEHIARDDIFLEEVGRVLAPNGCLVITTPLGSRRGYIRRIETHDHVREYLEEELLERLRASGFHPDRIEFCYSPAATILQELAFMCPPIPIVTPFVQIMCALGSRLTRPSRRHAMNSMIALKASLEE